MASAARATAVMKLHASTKSLKVKALWSLPASRVQPGNALRRPAMSGSASLGGRAMSDLLSGGGGGHDGRALDLFVADLRHVEALDVVHELLEGLVEGGQGLALTGEGRGAREDEVLDVGMVDPALLDLGHHVHQGFVGRAHQLGALLPLLEGLGEASLEELVHAAEAGREGAAGEALVLLVEEAEGDEVGRLELEGVVLFPTVRLVGGEAAIHADDLEGLLFEVVRLLRVWGKGLDGALGD